MATDSGRYTPIKMPKCLCHGTTARKRTRSTSQCLRVEAAGGTEYPFIFFRSLHNVRMRTPPLPSSLNKNISLLCGRRPHIRIDRQTAKTRRLRSLHRFKKNTARRFELCPSILPLSRVRRRQATYLTC